MRRSTRLKLMAMHSFGTACQKCGYSKCIEALHFHHLDGSEKYEWTNTGHVSPREVMAHPERFQLLCANCHIETHVAEWEVSKKYTSCRQCGKQFPTQRHRQANGQDKFCSRACFSLWRIAQGQDPEYRIKYFWERVNKTDTCWLWTGHIGRSAYGYGTMSLMDTPTTHRLMYAHRFSYELHHGAIPKGGVVKHTCNVPHCVNPSHLYLGARSHPPRKKPLTD